MSATSIDLSQIKTDALSAASTFRTLIGLGTLATQSPTGTANNTTYLRGDFTWQTISSGGTWGSITGTLSSQTDLQSALDAKASLTGATFTGRITTPSVLLSGNYSAAAWTTSGVGLSHTARTLTDTSSSGTVAAAYTNVLGGNTIAASSSTTFTEYASLYIGSPTAGSNVTVTNAYSLITQGAAKLGGQLTLTQGTANASVFTSTGYSLTGSNAQSLIDLAGTWNTTGTPTAIKLNVTDTASNAASLLLDLQVGGASKFKVDKDGWVTQTGALRIENGVLYLSPAASTSFIQRFDATKFLILNNGSHRYRLDTDGTIHIGTGGGIQWKTTANVNDSGTHLYILADAANTLAQRNSTNAQTFRLYNTYTDASNYERAKIAWESNVLWFGYEYGGTGNLYRQTRLGGSTGYFEQSSNQGLNATWGSAGGNFSRTQWLNGNIQFSVGGVTNFVGLNTSGSNRFTLADTVNIEFNTITGTKIGTGTTQKLAFWNATPIVQPAAVADATDAASVITQLNDLLAKLRTLGLIAT